MQRFLCCHYLFVASMGACQQVSVGGKAVNAKTGGDLTASGNAGNVPHVVLLGR